MGWTVAAIQSSYPGHRPHPQWRRDDAVERAGRFNGLPCDRSTLTSHGWSSGRAINHLNSTRVCAESGRDTSALTPAMLRCSRIGAMTVMRGRSGPARLCEGGPAPAPSRRTPSIGRGTTTVGIVGLTWWPTMEAARDRFAGASLHDNGSDEGLEHGRRGSRAPKASIYADVRSTT